MQLKTMLDIRADLERAGYDDAFIKDVIRARVAASPRNSNRRTVKAAAVAPLCPQARIDSQVASATPSKSNRYNGPRGLIMVGEW